MASKGKYVLAANGAEAVCDDLESEHVCVTPDESDTEVYEMDEGSDSASSDNNSDADNDCNRNETYSSSDDEVMSATTLDHQTINTSTEVGSNPIDEGNLGKVTTNSRMERIEKTLADLTTAINLLRPSSQPSSRENEQSWCISNDVQVQGSSTSVRWDHIKPFPSGVAANKMWEEWNRYIENFEIAASLSNANDPVVRTRLLFLSMGPDLQEIVRAAKLRPNLKDVGCYRTLVANINDYFRSKTDTAAEHEAFSCMQQEKGESAVAFHARLMCKVRLCGYSVDSRPVCKISAAQGTEKQRTR